MNAIYTEEQKAAFVLLTCSRTSMMKAVVYMTEHKEASLKDVHNFCIKEFKLSEREYSMALLVYMKS